VSIECNVGFKGFVFVSRSLYIVECNGDFDGMVAFFLGMVGAARFSSSLGSSFSSVSPLVVHLILVLVPSRLVIIAREVSYLSTIVTSYCSFVSFLHMGCYFIEMGAIVGGSLVASLGVVSAIFGSGLGVCILILHWSVDSWYHKGLYSKR